MTAATKKEAQAALNAARLKAQLADEALKKSAAESPLTPEHDARHLHYNRCIREFEEAINDMARFDSYGDDE